MPCSVDDIVVTPISPSGPGIPGFGLPFAIKLPNLNPFPAGFPEDLLGLLDKIQLLVPSGPLKPQLNANFGKDIFDGIMKLLDQFMPFLMLYKFFLPILEIIICIIEVLCSLVNPFKLIPAVNRLLTQCIPDFLNMFPAFAFIIMLISLLLLIVALVEYIIQQVENIILYILKNILALQTAFQDGDDTGVLAILKKLGTILCVFQNLFVLLSVFDTIIQIIKDILNLIFHIPPCADGGSGDSNSCCTPDVCPEIVKNQYTNNTGVLQYIRELDQTTSVPGLNILIRPESLQFYDPDQTQAQAFSNIYDAFDVTSTPKPIFFPTDSLYNDQTDPTQAAYQIDLTLSYQGRPVIVKGCIMSQVPSPNLNQGDLSIANISTGVANLVGGKAFEIDGITPVFPSVTLHDIIGQPPKTSADPEPKISDAAILTSIQYTFKPNIAPLLQKNLITLGCIPSIALNREFVNNVLGGDIGLKTTQLQNLLKSPNSINLTHPAVPNSFPAGTQVFPSPAAAQQGLATAVAGLRANMTPDGVTTFQATANAVLNTLKNDTNAALGSLVGIGFAPCSSTITTSPAIQFSSVPMTITVTLNEQNGLPLTTGLSAEVATNIASRLSSFITFGEITPFIYDGYQAFNATLTATGPGVGQLMVSFDNNIFCTNTLPTDLTIPPTHTLQTIDYQFIYAPSVVIPGAPGTPGSSGSSGAPGAGSAGDAGDTGGTEPRRDGGDTSRGD